MGDLKRAPTVSLISPVLNSLNSTCVLILTLDGRDQIVSKSDKFFALGIAFEKIEKIHVGSVHEALNFQSSPIFSYK